MGRPRHLVLVGLMATGKSTVGRLVAASLGRRLVDSDDQVEAMAGRTVREIWRTDGEAAFRLLETAALTEALADTTPSVIAAAGGVVLAEENRLLLSADHVEVVWLRARPATLVERVRSAGDGHRPLLDDDPAGMLVRMEADRRSLYESVADRVLDVDDRSPAEVARAITGPEDAR
ncbi:shikimate kinase [Actinospongicola halichondriae]|uniref:shikimate kinase n=1 Tax=Actinospongicola halichondriae TaxID=3236844 RepID=UPI003D389F82